MVVLNTFFVMDQPEHLDSQIELLKLEYKLLLAGKILPDEGKPKERLQQIEQELGVRAIEAISLFSYEANRYLTATQSEMLKSQETKGCNDE